MIFGSLELEEILQVNDKTRLSAVKSFVSKDEADVVSSALGWTTEQTDNLWLTAKDL